MKTKPDLGFWKLWNLSFGFFGVQIAHALQSANVSRIFTTIGADPHELSYFWILPPLMGLLVQPIVGMMSDRTWNRFGRRLPYLILGATIAVVVMCLLPNAGSFHFTVASAILFGLVALMLLDTSINMAMQPFKMLVGDMVNEKQKGLAYSIQSFLCNAGSIVGYIFPILLGWIGLQNTAPHGVVPSTVIWSFYIGAAILLICVVYSLVKIKEWPPHVYNEYNGGGDAGKEKSPGVISLLRNAPSTFWTVGVVQFFCWFAFLFLWTYATNTVAYKAFDTPSMESVVGITDGENTFESKNILLGDSVLILSHGKALAQGVEAGGVFYPASLVVVNGNDTIVADHQILNNPDGVAKARFDTPLSGISSLSVDGKQVADYSDVVIKDYLSRLQGSVTLTEAAIVVKGDNGKLTVEEATSHKVDDAARCSYITNTVLNAATPQYNDAGNWVGLLYAIQALGSVVWAVLLPKFRSRKFSYSLSLVLAGIGFIMMSFITNQWLLFVAFLLIGCGWAAMLAWPFTILTNSLHGGNIGAYLGLFNCTICVPQIIAALAGGWILTLLSTPGQVAPEYLMMTVAGISIIVGAFCVFFIKEGKAGASPQETPAVSDNI